MKQKFLVPILAPRTCYILSSVSVSKCEFDLLTSDLTKNNHPYNINHRIVDDTEFFILVL